MTEQEYQYIQEELSKLLKKNEYMGPNKQEIYEKGVLACKSKLKEMHSVEFNRNWKMTEQEYLCIQLELSKLFKKNKYMDQNKQEIYEKSVLACKSKFEEIHNRELSREDSSR